jgi:hypothetical protein
MAKYCQCATSKVALSHLKGFINKNPQRMGAQSKNSQIFKNIPALIFVKKISKNS